VEHADNLPVAHSSEELKTDYTWEPLIPPGHTSFSWNGQQGKVSNWKLLVDERGADLKGLADANAANKRKLSSNNNSSHFLGVSLRRPSPWVL
jgi:hypothetical protein